MVAKMKKEVEFKDNLKTRQTNFLWLRSSKQPSLLIPVDMSHDWEMFIVLKWTRTISPPSSSVLPGGHKHWSNEMISNLWVKNALACLVLTVDNIYCSRITKKFLLYSLLCVCRWPWAESVCDLWINQPAYQINPYKLTRVARTSTLTFSHYNFQQVDPGRSFYSLRFTTQDCSIWAIDKTCNVFCGLRSFVVNMSSSGSPSPPT